ncbi:hypothetical protein RRG08_047793 [Elysia crispata]|uniref:Uncharacterized protein n=1 Tax=Elysia crispata TaxID=231223 RepID=A0AAE1CRM6_9GAST|nr:hypothetical protein RRG08_047793 [Elysia crispata]
MYEIPLTLGRARCLGEASYCPFFSRLPARCLGEARTADLIKDSQPVVSSEDEALERVRTICPYHKAKSGSRVNIVRKMEFSRRGCYSCRYLQGAISVYKSEVYDLRNTHAQSLFTNQRFMT